MPDYMFLLESRLLPEQRAARERSEQVTPARLRPDETRVDVGHARDGVRLSELAEDGGGFFVAPPEGEPARALG